MLQNHNKIYGCGISLIVKHTTPDTDVSEVPHDSHETNMHQTIWDTSIFESCPKHFPIAIFPESTTIACPISSLFLSEPKTQNYFPIVSIEMFKKKKSLSVIRQKWKAEIIIFSSFIALNSQKMEWVRQRSTLFLQPALIQYHIPNKSLLQLSQLCRSAQSN